jgi:hypothetical protein
MLADYRQEKSSKILASRRGLINPAPLSPVELNGLAGDFFA